MFEQGELVESAGFVINFLKLEWPKPDDMKGRSGGFLSLGSQYSGDLLFTSKVCVVPLDKVDKYSKLAPEKVSRLASHPGHMLSSQSRNPKKNEWGGAVRGHAYLWGFSGLTEELDEIAMIGLALCKDDLTLDEVSAMFRLHHPTVGAEFLRVFKGMSKTDFEYGHFL